jgi:cobalt-zinc-cadmium efflux system protein
MDMAHDHTHHGHGGHSHAAPDVSGTVLGAAVGLTLAFVAVEALSGWFAHSLALISDAGHNLADAAALGLSWYAIRVAGKPSHQGMTFGYRRVEVFAALINGLSLVMIAAVVAWEAVARIIHPDLADGRTMIVVAAAAIVLNVVISVWLRAASTHNINVRSAYMHMLGDAVAALGVVIAGIIVLTTNVLWADPVVSLLIAGLIVYTSWDVLRESATILLEGTPSGLNMPEVAQAITGVAGVRSVHDLHVWVLGPGVVSCSCHILVAEQSIRDGQQVLRSVVRELEHRFGITHTTVQIEVEGCEVNDMYCVARKASARS